MTTPELRSALALLVPALCLWACSPTAPRKLDSIELDARAPENKKVMQIQYLEIVTGDVDAACSALQQLHGVTFGEPVPELGNARTATLAGGGRLGVRAPMRADEEPVVRPYVLVDDIEAAVKSAEAAGCEIAVPAMELPGQGKFAIYFQGGVQYGLWQL